ncbi:hypothetical protein P152DRAFT_63255 [Eremomyces bilateralis CBS 781.70]|uniref:Amidoligase enzyme n=1 Tax=Eremomyces bilateralis CBS 781.70 TaxID=1392243 RepID=A0A6G1FZR1_9PEZI|nr:uncharacterized protein P152DRAFT_63255 [Eremomyces bilateralis CBS 781.70]KAF1811166.1 hypothetical protein P152DRAFT_63255 [Eremomyces bilateralis CBS 781.70]
MLKNTISSLCKAAAPHNLDDSPEELTIGVEIELVLLVLNNSKYKRPNIFSNGVSVVYAAPFEGLMEVRHAIHSNTALTDVLVDSREITSKEMYKKWLVCEDNSVHLTDDEDSRLERSLAHLGHSGSYTPFGIELNSPIYKLSDQQKWSSEIKTVLRAVQVHFNKPGSYFHILTNGNTGFHVHIGTKKGGFSKGSVKTIEGITTVFERFIDQIHTASRISPLHHWSKPNTLRYNNNATKPGILSDPLAWWTAKIESVETWDGLKRALDCEVRNYAVNYRNLRKLSESRYAKDTVEFRQHRSTFDAAEIISWVAFVGAIGKYALRTPLDQVKRLLKQSRNPKYSFAELVLDLSCPPVVINTYISKMNRRWQQSTPTIGKSSLFYSLAEYVARRNAVDVHPTAVAVVIWKKLHGAYPQTRHSGRANAGGDFHESFLKGFAKTNWHGLNLNSYRSTPAWGPTEDSWDATELELDGIYQTFNRLFK